MTQSLDNEAHLEASQTRSLLLMPVTGAGDRDSSDALEFIQGRLRAAEDEVQSAGELGGGYLS